MALPEFSLRQLQKQAFTSDTKHNVGTHAWRHIYGDRNGIHIMDLTQTVPMLDQALIVRDTVAKGGRVLFVGTKRQASAPIADAAEMRTVLHEPPLVGWHIDKLEHSFTVNFTSKSKLKFLQQAQTA